LRKIFKPEDVRRDKRVVQIPDVEFEFTPIIPESESEEEIDEEAAAAAQALAEEEEKRIALETSLRAEIEAKVREELIGELGRKKITAQKQCDTIVRDAKIEAEAIIAQANVEMQKILNEAALQAQQIKAEAYNEGAKQGFEEKKKLFENLALYISHSIEEIKKERNEFFAEYEKQLKYVAVDICEKIISHKIEDDDMIMYGVIKDAVRYARDAKWVKAEVSSELSGYVDSLEQELHLSGQNIDFIFSDGIAKDTCILNTSDGLIDASVTVQLKNLREFINTLDKGDSDESKS